MALSIIQKERRQSISTNLFFVIVVEGGLFPSQIGFMCVFFFFFLLVFLIDALGKSFK